MGYQEIKTESVGNKLVAPTFLTVSESNKVSLADLKVSGYLPPEKNSKGKWINGCQANEFVIQMLTPNGTVSTQYQWLDTGTIGPGWFADGEGTAISGGSASITLSSGKAMWTNGAGKNLVPAGAVNPFDISFKTEPVGNSAVGNSTPVDLSLGDLTVTGYLPPEKNNKGKWINGCQANEFVIQMLTPNGTVSTQYQWLDTGTIGPGWFADGEGTAIDGGAAAVDIKAGNAMWVNGAGKNIVFPAPEL